MCGSAQISTMNFRACREIFDTIKARMEGLCDVAALKKNTMNCVRAYVNAHNHGFFVAMHAPCIH
jgi:hypothetical protein